MKIISRPQLEIDSELKQICIEIKRMNQTDDEWSAVESSDMFQTQNYCGGYDSIEQAFWFSYYEESGSEWWFEIMLHQIEPISDGKLLYLDLYEPN